VAFLGLKTGIICNKLFYHLHLREATRPAGDPPGAKGRVMRAGVDLDVGIGKIGKIGQEKFAADCCFFSIY
jgi:hypothetical protein